MSLCSQGPQPFRRAAATLEGRARFGEGFARLLLPSIDA